MEYNFKWKPELVWALATLVLYMLSQFVLTENAAPTSWTDWFWATAIAGLRAVAAAVIPRLTTAFTSK